METTQMHIQRGVGKEMVVHLLHEIKNEIAPFANRWCQLEIIMLSETHQS